MCYWVWENNYLFVVNLVIILYKWSRFKEKYFVLINYWAFILYVSNIYGSDAKIIVFMSVIIY